MRFGLAVMGGSVRIPQHARPTFQSNSSLIEVCPHAAHEVQGENLCVSSSISLASPLYSLNYYQPFATLAAKIRTYTLLHKTA
eukprot:5923489-Amphidinium_carterae.1